MSSASYDLHDKMDAYRRAGVPEYIVWQVLDRRISWFLLRDGRYVLVQADANGVIESAVFPGLRLNVTSMLAGDNAAVLAALNESINRRIAAEPILDRLVAAPPNATV